MLGVQVRVGVGGNGDVVARLPLYFAGHDGRQLQVGHTVHAHLDAGRGPKPFELPFQCGVRGRYEKRRCQQFKCPLLRHQRCRSGQQYADKAASRSR